MGEYFKEYLKEKAKQKLRKVLIKHVLPIVLIYFGIVLIISIMFTSLEGFFEDSTIDSRLTKTENIELLNEFKEKVENANKDNTFLENGSKIGDLVDYYGNDKLLKVDWSYIQAYTKYLEISEGKYIDKIYDTSINKSIDNIIDELKPRFEYEEATITTVKRWTETETRHKWVTERDGNGNTVRVRKKYKKKVNKKKTTKEDIYLLKKAITLEGTYELTYKNNVKKYSQGKYNYEVTKPTVNVFTQTDIKYDNFRAIILKYNSSEDVDMAMHFITNAAESYMYDTKNIDWAFDKFTITQRPIFNPDIDLEDLPVAANSIIEYAYNYLGCPYLWGARGEYVTRSNVDWAKNQGHYSSSLEKYIGTNTQAFDCSGFVQYLYRHYGIEIGYTTYTQCYEGRFIDKAHLKPGDLVFFGYGSLPHHVGMYIGDNKYIHAPQTGDVVKVSPLTRKDFWGAKRICDFNED